MLQVEHICNSYCNYSPLLLSIVIIFHVFKFREVRDIFLGPKMISDKYQGFK